MEQSEGLMDTVASLKLNDASQEKKKNNRNLVDDPGLVKGTLA